MKCSVALYLLWGIIRLCQQIKERKPMNSLSKICCKFFIFICTFVFISTSYFCQPATAYNLEHQQILDDKRKCVQCDFVGINLSGTFLNEVNLSKSNISKGNLTGAYLDNANLSTRLANCRICMMIIS